jgi:sec-independent protein translocase protein TatC
VFSCLTLVFISYLYKETLLFLVIIPIKTSNTNYLSYFIFTNIAEVFLVYIRLISFLAAQFGFFIFLYQSLVFLTPALFKKEYLFISSFYKLLIFTWILALTFLNYYLIPITWSFFINFHSIVSSSFIFLHFEAKLSEYLEFYLYLYYICIFYTQFFIVLFFVFNYFNISLKTIKALRKFYYFFFFLFSTLISPPDVFSQVILSIILLSVYELMVISFIFKNILARQIIETNKYAHSEY